MQTDHPDPQFALPGFTARWLRLHWTLFLLVFGPLLGNAAPCSYSVTALPGLSMIANQCNAVGGNTLNNVLPNGPNIPNGSQIYKWNCQSQMYEPVSSFVFGSWSLNYTLNPGEGAFFFNPTASAVTLNFNGSLPSPNLPLTLPANGCCIVSRQLPQSGWWDEIVGAPPVDADLIYRWDPVTESFMEVYQYFDGFGGWFNSAGANQQANVGESIWVCRGAATSPSPVQPCIPPPNTGMVGWWPLDELASATVYVDLSPGGLNPATVMSNPFGVGNPGSPSPVAGKVAGASFFVGPTTYGLVPNKPSINFGAGSFSADCWIRVSGPPPFLNPSQPVVDKLNQTSANTGNGYAVGVNNLGQVVLTVGDGTLYTFNSAPLAVVGGGVWDFIAVSVDRGALHQVTFHVNGLNVIKSLSPLPLAPAGNLNDPIDLLIGAAQPPGVISEHALDEVELFNRVLTNSEMDAIWRAGSAGKCKTNDLCHPDIIAPMIDCRCLTNSAHELLYTNACLAYVPDLCRLTNCLTDNCCLSNCVQTPAPGTPVGPGTHPIILTLTDCAGNSTTNRCPINFVVDEPTNGCPSCLCITNEVIQCVTNGCYTWTFAVTNCFTGPLAYLVVLESPGVVFPNPVIPLVPTLLPGEGTILTLTFKTTNSAPPTNVCFRLSAHSEDFTRCCVLEHCFTLPQCCARIVNECIICDTNTGGWCYEFDFINLSGQPVQYIYLIPNPYVVTVPPIILNPPLAHGGTKKIKVNITPIPGQPCTNRICFLVSAHTPNFTLCCAFEHCVDLPPCCKARTYTLDADFDLGTLVNVNHNPANNQLQLNPKAKPFPYLAVACSTRGTIVRIDVNTGTILGEYLSAPDGRFRNPSRTTVDKFGNVWVGNRDEADLSPAAGGTPKGSVVRIGLLRGGIRGDKVPNGSGGFNFVANLLGQYVQNPTYSTCVDRDLDGLIRTSRGLGDILSWNNAAGADTHGGVTTAQDECITIYTRVTGSGTRFVSIDCDNNVWTGGLYDRDFEKLNGVTGQPVAGSQFNINCGGYGGLVGGNGFLWSAASLMRYDPGTATGVCLPRSCYGVGINPLNCNIFVSSGYDQASGASGVMELHPVTGNVLNSYPAVAGGQGICVDGNGHVWVAQGGQVAHLAPVPLGHCFVGNVTGFQWATGVAEDSNGRIWATDYSANEAVAIDPLAGGPGACGAVPIGAKMAALTVNLGAGANPYNYSDMGGAVLLGATCRFGFWNVIHDGCAPGTPWGTLSWNASTPPGTSLKVEVRAADVLANLPAMPFTTVANNVTFCGKGIAGRYLEVRVSFNGAPCSTTSPILYDLTVNCCPKTSCEPVNHPPTFVCPDPVVVCPGASSTVTLTTTVTDADGSPIQVSWREGNNPPYQVTTVPAGGPPTVGTVTFTYTYPPGVHVIILALNDGSGFHDVCDITVNIRDITPPVLRCPDGISVTGFESPVPNFLPSVIVSDNCTPTPAIVLTQNPPAGTLVGPGSHPVTITATDASGNSSSCQTFYNVSGGVVIISPAKYAVFTAPANINVVAAVPTNAGPVRHVRFLQGGTVLSTVTNRPYQTTVAIDVPGFYPFRAQAVSASGQVETSDEIQIFVNPSGPAPAPLIAAPRLADDHVRFFLPTEPGVSCQVEFTDSLTSPTWTPLRRIVGDGSVVIITDTITNAPQRFYRVRMDQ